MKIYFTHLNQTHVKTMLNGVLKTCKTKTNTFTLIFSLDGNFRINETSKNIQRINYIDEPLERMVIDDFNIIIDKSKITYKDNISQIPYDSSLKKMTEIEYILRDNANVSFIIIYTSTGVIQQYYFNYNGENPNDPLFKEDINTFFSDL
jgi:hypothetical protein